MGTKSKIEWCDSTWNPITGCLHGCEYCYAKRIAERFGTGWQKLSKNKIHELDKPMKGWRVKDKKVGIEPYPYDFAPTFHRYLLDKPQEWKKPRNIFVGSMADMFGDWVPDEWIAEVMKAAEAVPAHRYLFLTKNPERYTEYGVPLHDNFWYGTTITGDGDADRFNYLPAFANIFISAEPLLVDFAEKDNVMFRQIDWIILGAETGNRKGKVKPKKEWVEKLVELCEDNGIPLMMKESLLPIVGEAGMKREMPDGLRRD